MERTARGRYETNLDDPEFTIMADGTRFAGFFLGDSEDSPAVFPMQVTADQMTGTVTASLSKPRTHEDKPRTHELQRIARKQRLAAAFRLFARFGLYEGSAGHISARDPERPDCYWLNPLEVHWAQMRASDLVLVRSDGTVSGGNATVNPAGLAIHGQILAARPDVVSVAHSHSPYGKAWSTLGRLLAPLTQDACAFFSDHVVFPFSGIVLDSREGEHIAETMGSMKAAILLNHGLLTVGGSVDEAAWWFISMERQCQVQLLAEAAGTPNLIDPETAAATAAIAGSPEVGRTQFQVLWNLVSRQEADLLD